MDMEKRTTYINEQIKRKRIGTMENVTAEKITRNTIESIGYAIRSMHVLAPDTRLDDRFEFDRRIVQFNHDNDDTLTGSSIGNTADVVDDDSYEKLVRRLRFLHALFSCVVFLTLPTTCG